MQKSNLSHIFFPPPKMMDEYYNVASCMELYLLSPACIIMRAQCMYMLVEAESWRRTESRRIELECWMRAWEMLIWYLEGNFGKELDTTRWTWLALLYISNHPWTLVCCRLYFVASSWCRWFDTLVKSQDVVLRRKDEKYV